MRITDKDGQFQKFPKATQVQPTTDDHASPLDLGTFRDNR